MEELFSLVDQNYSLIGQQSHLKGNFALYGTTHVQGSIEGDITMAENSLLVIGHLGEVTGSIHCGELEVHGRLRGNLMATGRVILHPGSHFEGEIRATRLVVHPGAIVNMKGETSEV
jgi:cytoskeletal protein CcmA (bactofilin family)